MVALETAFKNSSMKALAEVLSLSSMDLLKARLKDWMYYKYAMRSVALQGADKLKILVKG